MSSELQSRVYRAMGWSVDPKTYHHLTHREARIIAHYTRRVERGMGLNQAVEHVCHDIEGRNGHPSKPQRGKSHYQVTVNYNRGDRP